MVDAPGAPAIIPSGAGRPRSRSGGFPCRCVCVLLFRELVPPPMPRIEDYALIGGTRSAALVSNTGSIDWFCAPAFDSPAAFAALLGGPEHGRWQIAPAAPVLEVRRRYLGETLVLETEFHTELGVVAVIDAMPMADRRTDIVRLVECRAGRVPMQMDLTLRFDYGAVVPLVTRANDGTLTAVAGPDAVVFHGPPGLFSDDSLSRTEFTLEAGQQMPCALTWHPSHHPPPEPVDIVAALKRTEETWLEWSARCPYRGEWREPLIRSLITLKALTYEPTGGIVAAPTTSLPEWIGGGRNWDYRFCWMRDATLTLDALLRSGYREEAVAWEHWLIRAVAGKPEDLQILYGADRTLNNDVPNANAYMPFDALPNPNDPSSVVSLRVTVVANSVDAVTDNGQPLRRAFSKTILLRNARPEA